MMQRPFYLLNSCRHMAFVLNYVDTPHYNYSFKFLSIFVFFFKPEMQNDHQASSYAGKHGLSSPLRNEGCSLDYLRSPNNGSPLSQWGYRVGHRIPFSRCNQENIERDRDSIRKNLNSMFSGPEISGAVASQEVNQQYMISLNTTQRCRLIKRACSWPSMGKLLPQQVLTAELLQKIIDKVAEPVNAHKERGALTGVELRVRNR